MLYTGLMKYVLALLNLSSFSVVAIELVSIIEPDVGRRTLKDERCS